MMQITCRLVLSCVGNWVQCSASVTLVCCQFRTGVSGVWSRSQMGSTCLAVHSGLPCVCSCVRVQHCSCSFG
jgi:hypothetical protein